MHRTGSQRSEPDWQAVTLDLVRRAAHTLKANGLTFGAQAFAAACAELEQASRLGTLDGATVLAGEIERTWSEARPAIEALRA